VPSQLVHWYIAQMQPPMTDKLGEFLALSGSLRDRDREEVVTQSAQHLLKVHETFLEAVTSSSCSGARAVIRHACQQNRCVLCTQRIVRKKYFELKQTSVCCAC